MAEITLLSERQAKPGFKFVYMGGTAVCRPCPYRHACLTLDVGREYEVTRVRPIQHPCALQEGTANVVEVKPSARPLVTDARSAVAGSSIEIGRYDCRRIDCPNWEICAGPSVPPRQRYRLEKIDTEPATCLIGRSLRRVEVI